MKIAALMKIAVVTQQDRKAADAAWDQQDHKAYQGQPVLLGQPALKDRWDCKDRLDRWDQWDRWDYEDLLARLEQQARQAPPELPEQQARQAQQAP